MVFAGDQGIEVTELAIKRDNLLEDIESLVDSGRIKEAISRVCEATKITDQIKNNGNGNGNGRFRDRPDDNGSTKKELKKEAMKIKELEDKRDALLNKIDSFIEEGKAKEAIEQVEVAARLTQEMDKKSAELTTQLQLAERLTKDLGRERSHMEAARRQQVQALERPSEKLPKYDRIILNGIALGYQTPRKLSRHLNMDINTIQAKIDELNTKSLVKNSSDPVIEFFEFLRLNIVVDILELLTTRKLTNGYILTDAGYNVLEGETLKRIAKRLELHENIVERLVGFGLGVAISFIKPLMNYLLAIIGLLRLGINVVRELPSIIMWVIGLWVSGVFSQKS